MARAHRKQALFAAAALFVSMCCAAQGTPVSAKSPAAKPPVASDAAAYGIQIDPASGIDGARVGSVSPGSLSASAGLRRGDVIVAIDGLALLGLADSALVASERFRAVTPDRGVRLRVMRDGEAQEVRLQPRTLTWSTRPK